MTRLSLESESVATATEVAGYFRVFLEPLLQHLESIVAIIAFAPWRRIEKCTLARDLKQTNKQTKKKKKKKKTYSCLVVVAELEKQLYQSWEQRGNRGR